MEKTTNFHLELTLGPEKRVPLSNEMQILHILLGVFEAQVTVDRSRAVILQFCYDNGLGDRGGEKSVIPALQLTHSGTGVKETPNTKVLWEK